MFGYQNPPIEFLVCSGVLVTVALNGGWGWHGVDKEAGHGPREELLNIAHESASKFQPLYPMCYIL